MYTLNLDAVSKDNKRVGGKAAHLGEMIKAKLSVPPGFVVTTDAYERFLKENKLIEKIASLLNGLNVDYTPSLKEASEKIQALIINAIIPSSVEKEIKEAYDELSVGKEIKQLGGKALDLVKAGRETLVAVRSSATTEDMETASFAGQMTTILNVIGFSNLLKAVKQCWASLFTPQAIFYRKKKRISSAFSIAVIVQRMIESEKSGVMFTADPVTNNRDKILIEGSWGLGEAVVSGLVRPDEYVINKESGEVLDKKIQKKLLMKVRNSATGETTKEHVLQSKIEKQVLTDEELKILWEFGKRIEDYYGKPQDIEWCVQRGKVYIVQTRPITTLDKTLQTTMESEGIAETPPNELLLEGIGASPGFTEGKVRVIKNIDDLERIERGDVLLTKMTNPSMVPYMKKVSAIITDRGGRTSYASIISRELGIPCIVGTGNATSVLKEGQKIKVDATHGKIYKYEEIIPVPVAPEETPVADGISKEQEYLESTLDDKLTATQVKANIAFSETAEKGNHADGVGLLKAEHMLTESRKHPAFLAKTNPEELIQTITEGVRKIAKAFYPKSVWYRTLNARTDEFRDLEGGESEPKESNPMLGWHGIRRSLDEPSVFICEIKAIKKLHEEGLNNIAIMLPFISKVEELRKAKEKINEVLIEGSDKILPIKIGIMVETPATAIEIEKFCKEGIDFISIGSNDLTQLTLGVDRGNSSISKLYSESDPAVLELISKVIKTCKEYHVKTSICGEAGSNKEIVEKLVEMGIDSVSTELDAIDEIRGVVARTERRIILDRIRNR